MDRKVFYIAVPVGFVVIAAAVFTGVKLAAPDPKEVGRKQAEGAMEALGERILDPEQTKRSRERSKRAICSSNIVCILSSCKIYANEHSDAYPPALHTLIESGDITAAVLVCPSSGKKESDIEADAEACYVYIPGQGLNDDPMDVIAYEREDNHGGEGAHVVFNDGRVEFFTSYPEVLRLVEETKLRIAKKRPGEESRGA
jgi:hypothetical protein